MLERAKDAADRVVTQFEEARQRRQADLILELDLTEPLVDGVAHDPMRAVLARRRSTLRSVVEGLRRAGGDPRVRALVVKVGGARSTLAPAWAEELRDAVAGFRRQDKLTVAWAETFGELGRGSVPYYLASGFEEVWLQPSGDLCLTGVAAEVPFFREALDKAGITPQLDQRHEYKSAANTFTERSFTPAHRESTERLVDSVTEQLLAGIAAGRGLEGAAVRALVDRAPLFADEALEAGLVDRLGYRDEVYAAVRERVGEDAALQYVGRYQRSKLAELTRRMSRSPAGVLALVDVTGPIHLGKSGRRPFSRGSAGSDTVTAALRAATKAQDVKAIVLRVASPGGSYVASDAIWRQVALTQQAGKPVVVSMGDVAASGGYYVSMGADLILAEPTTITGSIGVVSGKPVVDGLARRLGITHEGVAGARHGLMFSRLREFSEDEWARMSAWLDRVYADFVSKVAAGRQLSAERMDELARGRVWTGADAHERGLVDQLGGLEAAVAAAAGRAELPAAVEPQVVVYPRAPVVSRLRPPASSEDAAAAASARAGVGASVGTAAAGLGGVWMDGWGTFADLAAALGLPQHGPLTLPGPIHLS